MKAPQLTPRSRPRRNRTVSGGNVLTPQVLLERLEALQDQLDLLRVQLLKMQKPQMVPIEIAFKKLGIALPNAKPKR